MSGARVGSLVFFALALQFSTDSLAAQNITTSLGENRQEILQPSAQITLPVLVDMTNAGTLDLASLQLRVTWDTAVVEYASWSAGAFGTIEANEDAVAGGTFQANLISATGTSNSFTAMNLTFDAGTAGSTVMALGMLAAGSESGGDLLSRIVANSVSVCINAAGILGDVTGGDAVDVIDAQQIARWLIDLAVTTSNRMRSHGDVNNDGQTNIVDAQQVARWAVELPVSYLISDAIVLDCADALTVSTTSLPTAGVGTEYSQPLSAAGPGGTYTWSISAGTLPAGLTLVGATISGTPTAAGTSEFTAKVTSLDGQIATRPLSIKVLPELSVTTASLPVGIVDTAYATTLTATGGDSTFTWSITSGTLPDGLTLSADTIAGTPTAAATSTFTVQAESGVGQKATTELSIVIHGTLSITTSSLSDGLVGSLFKDTLTATGGDGTYTWSVSAGTLPAGLTLNADTIAGIPTATDTSTVTLQVTSGDAQTTTKELSITVTRAAATVELSPTSLSFSSVSDTASLTATVKDHAGVTMIGAPVTWASSDTTKATVSSAGLVTAVANGTATITATSGSASATATTTVSQVASSVTLSPTSLALESIGDTRTHTPTVKDAGGTTISGATVTWATSNSSVATVSSAGLVTAVANGTATITATNGSVTATASVTVSQVATTLEVSPSPLSLISTDATATLTPTVKDAGGTTISGATVTWATSSSGIVTVSSAGLVTSIADGTEIITATSGSVSGTATVTVFAPTSPWTVTARFTNAPVTVICTGADVGDTGQVGGATYTKRSKAQIDALVDAEDYAPLATTCTSSVTDMSSMFYNAHAFNQDIDSWDVSSVTDMSSIFYQVHNFNGDIDSWNVSSVTDMSSMFYQVHDFNQDLSGWCVSNIITKPSDFDYGTSSWVKPWGIWIMARPVWGTCPS